MMYEPVPLVRHFSQVPRSDDDSDEQELRSIWSGRKRIGWKELEEEFRCIILAEAGAGKSFEMEARARISEEKGRAAFFIRIEDIENGFETAFEVGSGSAFESWLNSTEEAWFFLDSIDEARLENPRDFEKAIKRFAARIKPAHHRARVFISGRPYAWRARSDRILLERLLLFKKPASDEKSAAEPSEQESALRVYLLDPLDESAVRIYAEHRKTPEIDRLIVELQHANLMPIAARPFDLEGILAKWKAEQTLDGRLNLLQHNIDLRLNEIDPDRAHRQPLSQEKARHGARLLAAAVILTGKPGIRVPDSTQVDTGIDAKSILEDWEPAAVKALLERGIFNDALYGMVRFRHREVPELLAAEWFSHQLKDGKSRHATESLFFRVQYGHQVITPRLRPILPWLILFDDEIRCKAIGIAPEVAVEGGDASHLPFAERRALLDDIVRRIVEDEDDRSVRDNSAIARIAQPDLADDVLCLINDHQDNDEAIFFLGRLVWQSEMTACVPALSQIAANPVRGIFARIAAARAVMTCGDGDQKGKLWGQLNSLRKRLPRRLLAEIVENADPDMASVDFLLASMDKLEALERFQATGLGQALRRFVERLPIHDATGVSGSLAELVGGLNKFLDREPHIDRGECRVSEEFAWLLDPAIHAVERLVSVRSEAAFLPEALAIMLEVPVAHHWRDEDFDRHKSHLRELVPSWKELNDALFWRCVEEARDRQETKKAERLIDVSPVQWLGHYWTFATDRFDDVLDFTETRDFLDDKLVALSLAHWLFVQAGKRENWRSGLERAVKGNSALQERLDSLLNPAIPQSELDWKERERPDARRSAKRKR